MAKGLFESSTRVNILKYLDNIEIGYIFNFDDLSECGEYKNIRSAITRMCESGEVVRVAQGLYTKVEDNGNFCMPDKITIAYEMARRGGNEAYPKGETEKFVNGEIKKMPKILTFYTDGASRTLKFYDGTSIKFYHK